MSVLGVLICLALLAACWVPREPNKALFWGAVIGAGASLIGGALNRKAQKKANAANSPVGQVQQWEAAGINPLFGISSGGYIPQQAASMGDSFASAGAQIGQALDQNKEKELRETNLELQNDKLRKQLDQLARPSEPSHLQTYGGLVPLGSGQDPNGFRDSASAGPSPFASHQDDIGLPKRDVYNLYVDVYDPMTDRWVSIPNPDLMDAGPIESGYAMAQIGAADLLQNGFEAGGVGASTNREPKRPRARPSAKPSSDKVRPVSIPPWGGSPPRSIKPTQREIDRARFRRNALGGF